MASETTTKIPLIDFSKGSSEIKVKVTEALREYGCFEAVFPDVTEEELRPLFVGLKELAELPLQTKKKCPNGNVIPGYRAPTSYLPIFQFIGVEDPHVLQNLESAAKALWPDNGNPNLCKMLHSYSDKLKRYDQMIRTIVAESLGLEAYLDEHMESGYYTVRELKYDAQKSGEPQLGLIKHNDGGYITILIQSEDHTNGYGLRILTKDGNWIDLNPPPFTFVVIAGVGLGVWTNGRVRPCYHKVTMSGKETRYSTFFASIPKDGYKIKPVGHLIDEDHPLVFESYEFKFGPAADPIVMTPFK